MAEALPMAAAWYPGYAVRVAGFYSAFISEQALTDVARYERFLGRDIKREGGRFKDTNPTLSNNHMKLILSVL